MFENINNNKLMIIGAYKKLKAYYYYDKTILYNKMRLAMWESSKTQMKARIDALAAFMTTIEKTSDHQYLRMLMKGISLIPMPKAFEEVASETNLLQNTTPPNNKLSKVNFYIKAPVELLILDAIWMLMINKIAITQDSIAPEAYANRVKRQIYKESNDLFEGIDFTSNRLFIPYFKQYTSWRDSAFNEIRSRYKREKDSILISLDIKSYYYSVVFKFESLANLLNNDERLSSLEPLTNIIQSLYITYTAEMQKYRGQIPADCAKGESCLPIGLLSSMFLSNLYLRDFDKAIKERIRPYFYGRYVDDIMLVVDRTKDMSISVTNILHKILVRTEIIEPIDNNEYRILIPDGLKLQQSKVRCIYFDHTEPDAMIKLLCEASNHKPSSVELMPDINISEQSFDECAYSLGQLEGTLKVRNFLFSTNNYAATIFINDLIRSSKNVDVREKKHGAYIEKQLMQILKFYSSSKAIEFRSSWINIFTLILINRRFDYFWSFYIQTFTAIEDIETNEIEAIERSKTDAIVSRIKDALKEQLDLAASIAFAPMSHESDAPEVADALPEQQDNIDLAIIFDNAKNIRNSNMFNNHVSSFPLISYILDEDCGTKSLVEAYPKDIAEMVSNKLEHHIPLSRRKLALSPRFIHLDEICLINFLMHFTEGGNPFYGHINFLVEKFFEINNLAPTIKNIENATAQARQSLNLQNINVPAKRNCHYSTSQVFDSFRIAIASINLDEDRDIIPAVKSPRFGLSPAKKSELYALLNEAANSKANMIVFPEFFLPVDWLEEVYIFSRKNSISVISGLRYIVCGERAYNYLVVLQPFVSQGRFRYSIPLIREKNHYAPAESKKLESYGLSCNDPLYPSTHIISWQNLNYSDMMCYELTNIRYRSKLLSRIELLVVPELNPDTDYFSNIVEATSRDLHCYLVQVNTSKYGDSRITGPYNSMFKDIIKIKGAENNVLLLGTIELKKLLSNRNGYREKTELPQAQRRFKNPPASFDIAKEESK